MIVHLERRLQSFKKTGHGTALFWAEVQRLNQGVEVWAMRFGWRVFVYAFAHANVVHRHHALQIHKQTMVKPRLGLAEVAQAGGFEFAPVIDILGDFIAAKILPFAPCQSLIQIVHFAIGEHLAGVAIHAARFGAKQV